MGVDIDKHGVRHKTQKGIDPQQYADVVRARAALLSFVDKEALKIYVDGSSHDHESGVKHFLDAAETLQGIYKQETNEKIKQVRERVMLARRMLDIFELGSSSIKNAGGRIIRKSHPTLDPIIRNHLRLSKEKERAHRLGRDAGEGSGSNTAENQEDTSRKATLTRSKAMVGYGEDGPGSEEWQQIDEDLLSYLFDEPELTQNAS